MPNLNSGERDFVYAITPDSMAYGDVFKITKTLLCAGVSLIQYRDKTRPYEVREQQASALLKLCHQHEAKLIINDDVALAAHIQADGVHLGQSDLPVTDARTLLGAKAIIGVTCHQSLQLAQQAEKDQADYVAFGRFFASETKPEASPADMDILTEARNSIALPVVAIGGITMKNGERLLRRGANMIAMSHGLYAMSSSTRDLLREGVHISSLFFE